MTFLNFIKKYDNIDKFILFCLYLGFSVDETAKATDVTRQTVYNTIDRNKRMVRDYQESVAETVRDTNEA